MSAYIIARVDVKDSEKYGEYRALTPSIVSDFGGRFLVRGGRVETLEGGDEDRRIVVLEFPDMDTARRFYDSEAYRAARFVREGAADAQFIAVEGV